MERYVDRVASVDRVPPPLPFETSSLRALGGAMATRSGGLAANSGAFVVRAYPATHVKVRRSLEQGGLRPSPSRSWAAFSAWMALPTRPSHTPEQLAASISLAPRTHCASRKTGVPGLLGPSCPRLCLPVVRQLPSP